MAPTSILIELVGASASQRDALQQHLLTAGIPTEPLAPDAGSSGLCVSIDSVASCQRVGKATAAWIEQVPIDFKLRIDGPFADSTLHRLGTEYDEEIISESVAAAAYPV